MPNILGRVVETFGDTVVAAHYEAMAVAEVSDAMQMATAFAAVFKNKLKAVHAVGEIGTPAGNASAIKGIQGLLRSMTSIHNWAIAHAGEGHPINSEMIGDFEDAILSLRECLACVLDPNPWSAVVIPAPSDLEVGAKDPPQSWYDEDMGRLAGPR